MEISVILPTYNERENLEKLLPVLLKYPNVEVVVVDDNSSDGTSTFVKELMKNHKNLKLIERPSKLGLGSAYKDGFKATIGKKIVTMDADLSHDPKYIAEFNKVVDEEGADIVVGSRYVSGGRIVGWKPHRRIISWGANFLARNVLGISVRDATSGYRMYRREVFAKIASHSVMKGYEFQIEALFLAKKFGFKIYEYPIVFVDRKAGKSKLSIKDILKFLNAVLKLRFSGATLRH